MEVIGRLWDGFKFELVYDNSDFNKIDFLIKNGKCIFNRYLGLKDKNGVMIFEHDIVRDSRYSNPKFLFFIYFGGNFFKMSDYSDVSVCQLANLTLDIKIFDSNNSIFNGRFRPDIYDNDKFTIEVIENIHDLKY